MNVKQEIQKIRQQIEVAKKSLDIAVISYESICKSLFGDNVDCKEEYEEEEDEGVEFEEINNDSITTQEVMPRLPRGAAVILENLGRRSIEVREICDQLKYSKRTVEVYLSKLKTSGLAVFDGKGWKKAA